MATPTSAAVLQGGGEMGALMRATDWAATPLGAVDAWPQSLRTAVSILLDSKFPMYIAWGPEYVQLYNDGYRPILGSTKHPAAMGRRTSETFAESWHIIGPMFEGVRAGHAVGSENWMLPLDRYGYLEECYFTFSYSPIRDESGGVGGVHVTVTETTGHVLSARRLRVLYDIADSAAEAESADVACAVSAKVLGRHRADVPFALFYLTDEAGGLRDAGSCPTDAGRVPDVWSLAGVRENCQARVLENVRDHVGDIPSGDWPEPVEKAVALPLLRPGTRSPSYGVVVLGVSTRRGLDADYQSFLTLVAGHVANAIAGASARTEERQRSAALMAARREAEIARDQLLEVLESTQDSFFALDRDSNILLVNHNQEKTTGKSRSESLGRYFYDVFPMSPDSTYRRAYDRVINEGVSIQFEEYYEPLDLWTEVRASPTKNNGGCAVFYREIGARKRLEREREALLGEALAARTEAERARAQAETANRTKDEFLATVSHELRTPLTSILGWAVMLNRGSLDDEKSAHAIATIERSAKAQARLIDDLLDLARILQGKFALAVGPVELVHVVEAALDTVRPAAEAKGVRLQPVLDSHALIVGDAERLQQVAWNLLSNAIKFTPRGGRVQVTLRRAPSFVELVVADTGGGIAPEFIEHVFEPFRQADGGIARRSGGLGLGLSIVRSLIEMHGGTVIAESDGLGKGATFRVRLPMAPLRAAKTVQPSSSDRAEGLSFECPPALANLRLLVVDDERETRELVAFVLEQCGANVTTASSAPEAVDYLNRAPFDVLVSDVGMPEEDGLSFVRRLRQLTHENARMPALALTAYARGEDRAQALRAGFTSHLAKPIDPTELLLVIAAMVGDRRPR